MATPEPYPYRQLNYPVNNLEQNFDQTKKLQVRANIGIPTSVNKTGQVLTVGESTGELEWATVSGGGDLPSSSSADEGKVLTVDSNGEPQWSHSSGGDDIFLATYGTTTFDEIRTAHNMGKAVFLYAQAVNYNRGILLPLETCFRSNYEEQSVARFILPFGDYPSVGANSYIRKNGIYEVNGNDVWSTRTLPAIASPEATDIGKVYTATNTGEAMWVKPPKTKVVLVNAATSFNSQRFYWNLTAEQQAKVAGFTNPLVTVQVSLDLGAELQDDYLMQIMVHGAGDSTWYHSLPNGTNNPNREILKGIRYIQESSTGCYGYPIDTVMCDFNELTGGVTFPSSPSCTFTLIVEECET